MKTVFVLASLLTTASAAFAQAATPDNVDPVAALEKIVSRYEAFFAKRQTYMYKGLTQDSATGYYAQIKEVTALNGPNVRYDVRKTDSLVTPFTGHITVSLLDGSNSSCSTIGGKYAYGWPTEAEALQGDKPECYKPYPSVAQYEFRFSFQRGQWVLKDLIRSVPPTLGPSSDSIMLFALGKLNAKSVALEDPAAIAMNKLWADALIP